LNFTGVLITFCSLNVVLHETIGELDLFAGFEGGQAEVGTRRAAEGIAEIALEVA
jgi:hypothetical protein